MPLFRHQQDVQMLTHLASCLIPTSRDSGPASELGLPAFLNLKGGAMGKYNKSEPLTRLVGVRLSEGAYNHLEDQRKVTNCQTLGEFVRMILQREKIIWYHQDASLEPVMVELVAIRKELRSIGTNINQVTRHFNSTAHPGKRVYEALKILDEFRQVHNKIEPLFNLIEKLEQSWSPKS